MKKLFLLIGLVVFLNATNLFAKELNLNPKDYKIDEMVWMWHKTTLADKRIIENNQKGIMSKKYTPGPLSTMEIGLKKLKFWYLNQLELTLEN